MNSSDAELKRIPPPVAAPSDHSVDRWPADPSAETVRRAILFRFHDAPVVCENRLTLLRRLNPGIPIFGLFGGPPSSCHECVRTLHRYFDDLHCIKGKTSHWKWLHGDLSLRSWFAQVGRTYSFDVLCVTEWDLLLLEPLGTLYSHVPSDAVGLTGLVPLSHIQHRWYWTTAPRPKRAWARLLSHVRSTYGYEDQPRGSLGPGACLPRAFLEGYTNLVVPLLCHEELRLPLYSQVLGFSLRDTLFCRGEWFDSSETLFFNCTQENVRLSTIRKELSKENGRRAFHPFKDVIQLSEATSGITAAQLQQSKPKKGKRADETHC